MAAQLIQAPFQWATIFHKEDINFTNSHYHLIWYDPLQKLTVRHLPCRVQCDYCKTPIMDEGRNMILLFHTLLESINVKKGRDAFKVQCYMFYRQRVVDIKDDVAKWSGMDGKSERLDEEGEENEGDGGQDGEGNEDVMPNLANFNAEGIAERLRGQRNEAQKSDARASTVA